MKEKRYGSHHKILLLLPHNWSGNLLKEDTRRRGNKEMLRNVGWIEMFVSRPKRRPVLKMIFEGPVTYVCGESHHLCNQENSVKDIEVNKYRREVFSNFRLKYIVGFLCRKFRNRRPERKFHDGLIIFKQK
jgi:hypothetical protein